VRVLFENPGLALLDCSVCRRYVVDAEGKPVRNIRGEFEFRSCEPDCSLCDKAISGFRHQDVLGADEWSWLDDWNFLRYHCTWPRSGGLYEQDSRFVCAVRIFDRVREEADNERLRNIRNGREQSHNHP